MGGHSSDSNVLSKKKFFSEKKAIEYLNKILRKEENDWCRKYDPFIPIKKLKNNECHGFISGNNYRVEIL